MSRKEWTITLMGCFLLGLSFVVPSPFAPGLAFVGKAKSMRVPPASKATLAEGRNIRGYDAVTGEPIFR